MPPLWDNAYAEGWSALLIAIPLFCAARQDLREMLIDDWIHFALLGMFLVWGVLFLSPAEIGWRLFAAFVVLALGVAAALLRGIGGGDLKLAAAITPFLDPGSRGVAMILFALALFVLLLTLKTARARAARREGEIAWKSLRPEVKKVPMGVALAGAAVVYRVLILPI